MMRGSSSNVARRPPAQQDLSTADASRESMTVRHMLMTLPLVSSASLSSPPSSAWYHRRNAAGCCGRVTRGRVRADPIPLRQPHPCLVSCGHASCMDGNLLTRPKTKVPFLKLLLRQLLIAVLPCVHARGLTLPKTPWFDFCAVAQGHG